MTARDDQSQLPLVHSDRPLDRVVLTFIDLY
jgi:hypothetical protein